MFNKNWAICSTFYLMFSLTAQALVGGKIAENKKSLVSFKNDLGVVFCSGTVVGVKPLTILTAAHCAKESSSILDFKIEKFIPKSIRIGNPEKGDEDLAVLVYSINGASLRIFKEDIFYLTNTGEELVNYRGKIEICGSGDSINSNLVSQNGGVKKCGHGLFLEHVSYRDGLDLMLFSKKFMDCYGQATEDEFQGLNYAEVNNGDSGGPLFRRIKDKDYLYGINGYKSWSDVKSINPLCPFIVLGDALYFGFVSVTNKNTYARKLFKEAKRFDGADIDGI